MKWKPDMAHAWVMWASIGFGQTIYVLYVPNFAYPLGLVWGVSNGVDVFNVVGSFVHPWVRRCGVRTQINKAILAQAKVVCTARGSKTGGLAFLKASGYKWSKELLCFYKGRGK